MCAVRTILVCMLLLCLGITCQAFTFEKVGSTFDFSYDISLNCTPSDPGVRDWDMNSTSIDTSSSSLSLTPSIKTGTEWLAKLDHLQSAETKIFRDSSGESTEDISSNEWIYTSVHQRPELEFYQPAWYTAHDYFYQLTATTSATACYLINPLSGENKGDEVMLTVEGWTEHEENWRGPDGSAIKNEDITNNPISPTFSINGINMGPIDGQRFFTAHIGDTICMTTSVSSTVNSQGKVVGWPSNWTATSTMPLGLFVSSSINVAGSRSPTSAVPEPSSLLGLGSALAMLAPRMIGTLRRRRN